MAFNRLTIQWRVSLLIGMALYQTRATTLLVKESSTQLLDESARARLQARGVAQGLGIERFLPRLICTARVSPTRCFSCENRPPNVFWMPSICVKTLPVRCKAP